MRVQTLPATTPQQPTGAAPAHDPAPKPPPWQTIPPDVLAAAVEQLQSALRDLAAAKAQVKAIAPGDDRGVANLLARAAQAMLDGRRVLDMAGIGKGLSGRLGSDALALVELVGRVRQIGTMPKRNPWEPPFRVPVDELTQAIDRAMRDADVASEVLRALMPGGAGVAAAEAAASRA